MKLALGFLLIVALSLAFWGCPTRKYIPDPTPPEPQVIDTSANAYDELLSLEGRAPHVGPKVEFRRMLAATELLFHGAFIDVRNSAGQRDKLTL